MDNPSLIQAVASTTGGGVPLWVFILCAVLAVLAMVIGVIFRKK